MFLAQVAHELRHPLGAITTAAGLLDAATVSPATKNHGCEFIVKLPNNIRSAA